VPVGPDIAACHCVILLIALLLAHWPVLLVVLLRLAGFGLGVGEDNVLGCCVVVRVTALTRRLYLELGLNGC